MHVVDCIWRGRVSLSDAVVVDGVGLLGEELADVISILVRRGAKRRVVYLV